MVARATALSVPAWPIDAVGVHQVGDAPRSRFARGREALGDAALLLTIAYSLPFVILLVGAPLALGINLLLKLMEVR